MPGIGRTSRIAVSKMTGIFLHPAPLASNAPPSGALCLRLTAPRSRPAAPCFARPPASCSLLLCCLLACCCCPAAERQRTLNLRAFACLSAPLRSIPVQSRRLPMRKSKPHDQPDAELFCALRLLLLRRFAVNTGRSAFILSHSQYRTGSRTTFLPPFLSRLAAENGGAVTRMNNCGMKNEIMQ